MIHRAVLAYLMTCLDSKIIKQAPGYLALVFGSLANSLMPA